MSVKIVHAADFHLDSAFGALSAEQARQRRRESRGGAVQVGRQKGAAFLTRGFRSEPRVLPAAGEQNTLSPRKVFFATYTLP